MADKRTILSFQRNGAFDPTRKSTTMALIGYNWCDIHEIAAQVALASHWLSVDHN